MKSAAKQIVEEIQGNSPANQNEVVAIKKKIGKKLGLANVVSN